MQFRKDLPESGAGKNYLKIKDKESVSGIFRGKLHEFFVRWENGKASQVEEGHPEGKFRFRVNFVVKEGPSYVPKIFEQGLTVYRQLAELHEEYDLENIVVKITRNGTGTDTTYSILPLLKQELSPEAKDFISKMELHPLDGKSGGNGNNFSDDSIPF